MASTSLASPDDDGLSGLPYWQVNVPPDQRTAECPAFLRSLSPKDERIVGTRQRDYAVLSWADVRAVVAANELDRFQRDPLALRRYLAYSWDLKQRYGSAVDFVLQERLRWSADELRAAAAAAAADRAAGGDGLPDLAAAKVLCNDWPYGIDPRIVHLVVWLQAPLPDDPATGDLTAAARAAVDAFVQQTFGELPRDHYVWFRNWLSLRSVRAVEHVHVMLFDPPPDLVARVTHGDVPLSKRLP